MVKDFYEYEEGVVEEEIGKNKWYDSVEYVEYELFFDFEVLFCLIYFCFQFLFYFWIGV